MGKRYFSRSQATSSSDDRNFGSGMMHLSKGSLCDEGEFFIEFSDHRINLTYFQDFREIKRWKNAWKCFAEHRFSTSWSSDHKQIMKSSCCNAQCSFCEDLSLDMCEIIFYVLLLNAEISQIFCITKMWKRASFEQEISDLREMSNRNDRNV